MDQSNMPSHSSVDKSVKPDDDRQFPSLDASKQIKNNFTISQENVLLCLKTVQNVPTISSEGVHPMAGESTLDESSDIRAKLSEVRKKGRPPKPENQLAAESFQCNLCSKVLSSSSSLAKHRITHNEERKFVCPECSKTFKRNDHLTGHMLTHSDVKPFSCDRCDKSYCDSRSLKRHVDQYHPEGTPVAVRPERPEEAGRTKTNAADDDDANAAFREQYAEGPSSDSASSTSTNSSSQQVHLCRLCGRTFKNLQALNGHMRHHVSNNPKKEDSNQEANVAGTTANIPPDSLHIGRAPESFVLAQASDISSLLLNHAANLSKESLPLVSGSFNSAPGATESKVYLLNDSNGPPAAFLVQPQQPTFEGQQTPSYSLQLQHLARQVQPGLLYQLQGQQQVQQAKKANSLAPNHLGPSSHSLLHSLLSRKGGVLPENLSDQVPVRPLPDPVETSENNEQFELLESYPEDVSFDDIDGLLDQSGITRSKESPESGEASVEEEAAMETSIPEDLRNIPTHALQMFSLASSSGKPENSARPVLGVNDAVKAEELPQDFMSDYPLDTDSVTGEDVKAMVVEALVARAANCPPDASWNYSDALSGEIIEKILDIPKSDCSYENSTQVLAKEEAPSEEEKLDETSEKSKESSSSPQKAQRPERFRNPGFLKIKRRNWPGPLIIPPSPSDPLPAVGCRRESGGSGNSNFAFQSRLRSPRIMPGSGAFDASIPPPFNLPFVPYTPPPMLSPVRSGSGLFCLIQAVIATQTPPLNKSKKPGGTTSPDLFEGFVEEIVSEESSSNDPPASDIQPHINEGEEYQAAIPDLECDPKGALSAGDHADIVWDPSVLSNVSESEVRAFMEFSSCAAVPHNGCNKELAHHVLHVNRGDVKKACLAIMEIQPLLPFNSHENPYKYSETSVWSPSEIDRFTQSILKNRKDFFLVSKEVATKTCKECIEFYYLWKKVCAQESIKLKATRRRNDNNVYNNLRSRAAQQYPDIPLSSAEQLLELKHSMERNSTGNCERHHTMTTTNDRSEIQSFPFPSLLSPEVSQQAKRPLHGAPSRRVAKQPRGGGKTAKHRPPVAVISPDANSIFPCKICKKVFFKVKSRSAHMKTHRMQTNPTRRAANPAGPSQFVYEYQGSSPSSFRHEGLR